MTKRRPRVHLWFALLMITLLSFVTAAAAFAGMNAAGNALIRSRIYTREKIYAREKEYFSELLGRHGRKTTTAFPTASASNSGFAKGRI